MTITDDTLDRALRACDPAAAPLTDHEMQAAEEHLMRLLDGQHAGAPAPTPLLRRRSWRWLAPVVAVMTAGVVLSWPHSHSDLAFASWTPQATPATPAVAAEAGKGCRASLAEALAHSAGQSATPQASDYRQVLTEVRGPWVFTALASRDGSAYNCLAASTSPGDVVAAGGSIATAASVPVPPLGTREFTTHDRSVYEDSHGAFTTAQGQVGAQVVKVTIHADGHDTTATVHDGYFAAWWPIAAGGKPSAPRYDLTLADGQVLRNHTPLG